MKKHFGLILTIIGVIVLLGAFGYLIFSESSKKNEPTPKERVTLQGTYTCLPHADTSGPTTLECAFGLKTDDGKNYALDFTLLESIQDIQTGERIEVAGPFTPADDLAQNDRLRIYDIAGLLHVTSVKHLAPHADSGEKTDNNKQIMAGGELSFVRPDDFGLAVNQDQLPANSYIPPCDQGFEYCLYYNGNAYEGTNFESAGIRINRRDDLATKEACLTTPPDGYTNLTPETHEYNNYATGVFQPIGDAAVGHYAEGALYRLALNNTCYEFETRIGTTQFANYEPGTIEEFTKADKAAMENKLHMLLQTVRRTTDEQTLLFQ